jgi:NDP-sugar pyrophosphorylase family protein
MSSLLNPNSLFSLESYAHAALFEGCTYAWEPLGKLLNYLAIQKLGIIDVVIPHGVILVDRDQISIGAGTVIEPGVLIQGPCIIGKDCVIRHGAYIRGGALIGDHCVIGHDTEVKHSIFLNHASAPHFNYVGDSIVGNNANLGAGVKCANVRLDRREVTIKLDGEIFETGLKKCGALIGDGAQLGCNCVTNPGTVIAKQGVCFPCKNVGGYIAEQGILS